MNGTGTDTDDRRSGLDRRRNPPRAGRAVYSRGPIVLLLEIAAAITALMAIAALVASLTTQASSIGENTTAIRQSAQNTCLLLRRIVLEATPKGKQAQAMAFVGRTELRDCHAYAYSLKIP